jgi:hypothetical protein
MEARHGHGAFWLGGRGAVKPSIARGRCDLSLRARIEASPRAFLSASADREPIMVKAVFWSSG